MTLREQLGTLRTRAERQTELLTEEATKNALVMPMLRALGYDVFDPAIVIPEFTADFGTKKGEKVDYAIRINGDIQILIECKPIRSDLAISHASQLYRYFSVTKARFSILTNGSEWRFFTDLDQPNKMDEQPFFIFDLLDYSESDILELEKFQSTSFSVDGIISAASDLKLRSLLTATLRREFTAPSDEFVRMIGRRVYDGNLTSEVRAKFVTLIAGSIADILREQANQRLKDAIERPGAGSSSTAGITAPAPPAAPLASVQNEKTETTSEEREAFHIIRAILRKDVDVKRIAMRDAASYCAILLDDNNRRPIARLYLESKRRRIGIFLDRIETRHDIAAAEDIYGLADHLQAALRGYNPNG
jgi:hypothetical protein